LWLAIFARFNSSCFASVATKNRLKLLHPNFSDRLPTGPFSLPVTDRAFFITGVTRLTEQIVSYVGEYSLLAGHHQTPYEISFAL
jgi:hypothetical protein